MPEADMPLFDVVAVSIETGVQRLIAEGKTLADADAVIAFAVMKRGVDEKFFKVVPAGSRMAVEPTE